MITLLLRLSCSGQYSWPEGARRRYPPALLDLAAACLTLDPAQRPFVAEVKAQALAIAASV
jgi:hypothetical protein